MHKALRAPSAPNWVQKSVSCCHRLSSRVVLALSAFAYYKAALQMMVNCCATDETACSTLKAEYPEVANSDPDMNPDFCAMHGNVCSRCAAV